MGKEIVVIKKSIDKNNASYTHSQTGIEHTFSKNGFHIGKYCLPKGVFLYTNPTEHDDLIKSYTMIEGHLMDLQTKEVLTVGDVFVIDSEKGIHAFYTLEDTLLIIHEQQSPKSITSFIETSSTMIHMLSDIQAKDNYTKEHCDRVYHLAKEMGLALNYHSKQIYNLNKASRFHDIGKVYIEDDILNKPTRLNGQEFERMKEHPTLCREIILEKFDEEVFKIINQHHERVDGSGYPAGLKGDQIVEEAKILAICDSFDAMTTDRIYKKGMTKEDAFEELESLAGTYYDGTLVKLFIALNR
jgi:HD-GYP domain-containing protein (c-di-GMP phosphodiesterase class II)